MGKDSSNVAGKSVERLDAALKATGTAEYAADHYVPGLLTAKVLRSPHPHARILSLDTSRVQSLEGVLAVATAADLPRVRTGRWLNDRTVFAWDKVRHAGEAIAAVAAVDEETAEEALERFHVEYETLPAIFDHAEAMKSDSILVHEELASYVPTKRKSRGNVINEGHVIKGDVKSAFSQADLIYKSSYITPLQHSGFLQPHQCLTSVDVTGKLTVWTSTKDPFRIREHLCKVLNLPASRVRVIAGMCGGDFGGKGTITIEGICACLALKSGKPVRLISNWQEELGSTFARAKAVIELEAGVKNDGTLLALRGRATYDCGAYMDSIAANLDDDLPFIQGPYRIPNVDLSASMVYTNNPPTGNVRGVRRPQGHFAIESHIDDMARKLDIDPIEMRLRNVVQDGDVLASGGVLRNVSAKNILSATAAYMKKQEKSLESYTGWGIALGQYNLHALPVGLEATSACVKVNEDGTATLLTGSTEQGGGILTVLKQIAAHELGISMDMLSLVSSDTDISPYERGTGGSVTTYRVGAMVRLAAQDAREQLLSLATKKLEVEPDKLDLANGKVFVRDRPGVAISIKELAKESISSPEGPILGTGFRQRKERFEKIEAEKGIIDGPSYGALAVKVRVDPLTGKVTVLKCYSVWDAGFAINPDNVRGQIEGGAAFGLGYALTEQMVTAKGKVLNNSLMDYRLPTCTDIPNIEVEILEVPSNWGPYGAKGLAEGTNCTVAPAVANAVCEATGIRITELPLIPERVFLAVKSKKVSKS